MLRRVIRDILKTDWSQARAISSLPCTVAIAVALSAGLAAGKPTAGMVAASGAMSVGFGAFQRLGHSRVTPMFWASVGMAVSTAVGSLATHSWVALGLNAAAVGLLYGLMTAVSGGTAWISLQCAIFALVATGYPATPMVVMQRALLILAGGLLQLVLVLFFRRLRVGLGAEIPPDAFGGVAHTLRTLRANLSWSSSEFRYAVRLAVTLALAAISAHHFALSNSYWVPMTALLVLRTDLHETLTRGVARMAGTIMGAGLATLVVSLLRPGPAMLALLVILFAWLCYSTVMVSYGTLSASVTAYIAFLLALGGLPEAQVALHRVANTCLGGGIALLASIIAVTLGRNLVPTPPNAQASQLRRDR
jgi:hypothetical protein